MTKRIIGLLVTSALVCGVGLAQTRLGEVAGSIRLNPEAVVEKEGYTEDPAQARRADGELLGAVINACLASAVTLHELVTQTRETFLYGDDGGLPARLENAIRDLEAETGELDLLRLGESFRTPHETAREAAGICAAAGASVREELARRGVRFVEALEGAAACRSGFERASAQLTAILEGGGAAVDQASEAPPEEPTEEEIIAEVCAATATRDADAGRRCEDRQYRAAAALESRTPENEMLPAEVFGDLRQICAELHPKDFALRNECEIEKMTAARIGEP